ncbi:MAG: hypothetical protein HYT83_00510 [Candidatus Levybacteria bacterium]|nr:hypothetical protein [Candidatus Levybacteria bacterium]
MAYKHTNTRGATYYLHKREVTLQGSGRKQTIYYFAREVGDNAINDIPSGFTVVESKRSGLPVLKKA